MFTSTFTSTSSSLLTRTLLFLAFIIQLQQLAFLNIAVNASPTPISSNSASSALAPLDILGGSSPSYPDSVTGTATQPQPQPASLPLDTLSSSSLSPLDLASLPVPVGSLLGESTENALLSSAVSSSSSTTPGGHEATTQQQQQQQHGPLSGLSLRGRRAFYVAARSSPSPSKVNVNVKGQGTAGETETEESTGRAERFRARMRMEKTRRRHDASAAAV